MKKVAWIGVGRIGQPMARRLLEAEYQVSVFDLDAAASNALGRSGAQISTSPAEAAHDADFVCLCVSDAAAVEEVVFGCSGVTKALRSGGILVDHSSTHPTATQDMAARAAASKVFWVDAPISGGPEAAENGSLTVWTGGDVTAASRAEEVIRHYGSRITYMGAAGMGQIAKSCNQAIVANTIAVWVEMIDYAKGNGLDPITIIDSLEGGSADSIIRRAFSKLIVANNFPALSARNMIKDLEAILDLAAANGVEAPMSDHALSIFLKRLCSQDSARTCTLT